MCTRLECIERSFRQNYRSYTDIRFFFLFSPCRRAFRSSSWAWANRLDRHVSVVGALHALSFRCLFFSPPFPSLFLFPFSLHLLTHSASFALLEHRGRARIMIEYPRTCPVPPIARASLSLSFSRSVSFPRVSSPS